MSYIVLQNVTYKITNNLIHHKCHDSSSPFDAQAYDT